MTGRYKDDIGMVKTRIYIMNKIFDIEVHIAIKVLFRNGPCTLLK